MVEENSQNLSRRKFLAGAGALAASAVAAGSVFGVAPGLASSEERVKILVNDHEVDGPVPARIVKGTVLAPVRPVAEALGAEVAWEGIEKTVRINSRGGAGATAAVPAWPWPYKKLDPAVVRKRGYENYFNGGCMFGAASALLLTLQEQVGFPYTTMPVDMFKYGAGGVGGWGTLCGALNGTAAVLNLVHKDYAKIVNELMGWYTEYPFPSKDHEAYCKFPGQVQTVAKSPLCHASVSLWSKASSFKVNSDQKKDRCAKLTGDTAAHAVEMLNLLVDGKFIASYKASEEFAHCLGCHNGPKSPLDNEQGLMNCVSCHEPHQN